MSAIHPELQPPDMFADLFAWYDAVAPVYAGVLATVTHTAEDGAVDGFWLGPLQWGAGDHPTHMGEGALAPWQFAGVLTMDPKDLTKPFSKAPLNVAFKILDKDASANSNPPTKWWADIYENQPLPGWGLNTDLYVNADPEGRFGQFSGFIERDGNQLAFTLSVIYPPH